MLLSIVFSVSIRSRRRRSEGKSLASTGPSPASAFAFPSHAEGFGLPILEAFACECPVVTSASSGTGEVAGDAAALVDPSDSASIAEGLVQVISDEGYRADLKQKGVMRARSYSWDESARLLLEAYRIADTGGQQ